MTEPKTLTSATDFHDFFKAIPFWKWTTNQHHDKHGRSCAIGHIAKAQDEGRITAASYSKLIPLMNQIVQDKLGNGLAAENDAGVAFTAKRRIVRMFKRAMKAGL